MFNREDSLSKRKQDALKWYWEKVKMQFYGDQIGAGTFATYWPM
jgi:hypothetical protein